MIRPAQNGQDSTQLIEIHRHAKSSGIPQIAGDIRHGTVPALPVFADTYTGVSFIEADIFHAWNQACGGERAQTSGKGDRAVPSLAPACHESMLV